MRKQDYLLDLVQSLSPNEKRYFKLYANLQPGQKSYLKLYEILEKEPTYDAALISKKLKTTAKKLADDKDYLQQVLLRALRNFEQDVNPLMALAHRYLEAEMLKRRGMVNYALSQLDKMYEKTILYEQFGVFIDAFLLRQTLVRNIEDPSPRLNSRELFRTQIEGLNDLMEIKSIYNEMRSYMVYSHDKKSRAEIDNRPVMKKKPEDLKSLQAKVGWYNMKGQIAVAVEGIGESSAFYTTMANKIYEENPVLRQIMPEGYIRSYMIAADCMPADQMELGLKMINKAISIMDTDQLPINERMMSQLKSHAEGQKLIVLNNLFRYSECAETAEAILDPGSNFHRGHTRIALLYVYAASLLYTAKADKAIVPLREILKGNNKARLDIQLNAMLLELMVQYDLKNYALIPYLVSSVRKWIKRKGIQAEKSNLYLKWMLRISVAVESGKSKAELNAFLNDINEGKIKIEKEVLNIQYWLQNKLQSAK
jgi:hypothetical protein